MQATVEDLRRRIAARLRRAFGGDDRATVAGLDARLIVAHALALAPDELPAVDLHDVPGDAERRALDLAARRAAGEPVARLTARKEFYGLELTVSADTLIPRPDTETVVEVALAAADRLGGRQQGLTVLDLGTGAGGLLLALLAELPQALGIGVDVSPGAVATAHDNAHDLGLGKRASFVVGDWATGIVGPFDLVVANPPYIRSVEIDRLSIEVRRYDPRLALDGGQDGLAAYRKILPDLPRLLTAQGVAVMEIGHDQARAAADLAVAAGFHCTVSHDLGGRDRVLELTPRPAKSPGGAVEADEPKMGLGNQARNG